MLINSANTSPAHQATSTSGLFRRQQNGNLFDFKPDSSNLSDGVLRNSTDKHYGTTNGIRSVNKVASIHECENILNRTKTSSSSSSCSASSSGLSSSSQGLY